MQVDLKNFIKPNQTVAVALSGGSDSMALLHYMLNQKEKFPFNVVSINVEHGIRGENSIFDTNFVKSYCNKNNIPLVCYSVDSVNHAKEKKLSIEQSARVLRYECFYKAIESGVCDLVATAHHQSDNVETILFNLRSLRKGKTTIMIAHRISTVQSLDLIVVMDEGKIVDLGTHEELLGRCELYNEMVRLQSLESEINGGGM